MFPRIIDTTVSQSVLVTYSSHQGKLIAPTGLSGEALVIEKSPWVCWKGKFILFSNRRTEGPIIQLHLPLVAIHLFNMDTAKLSESRNGSNGAIINPYKARFTIRKGYYRSYVCVDRAWIGQVNISTLQKLIWIQDLPVPDEIQTDIKRIEFFDRKVKTH